MAHPHNDSLLMTGEEYDPAQVDYELAKMPAQIERLIQVLSPRATDRAMGTNLTLPVDNQPFPILPMDRSRVRSIIKIPANTPAGAVVAIGMRSDVGSGGGFLMYPGDSITVETCAEVCAILTATPGTVVVISRWTEIQAE